MAKDTKRHVQEEEHSRYRIRACASPKQPGPNNSARRDILFARQLPVAYALDSHCFPLSLRRCPRQNLTFFVSVFPSYADENKKQKHREVVMESRPHPVHKAGDRHSLCPYYEKCLDHAVEHHWKYWNCSECPHKKRKKPLTSGQTVKDHNPSYELPSGIRRNLTYRFD